MSKENGRWLRAQRQARAWNVPKMAHEMRAAATAAGDNVPTVATMEAHIRRWERGVINPSERYMLYDCKAFGIRADQYGPGNDADQPADAAQQAAGYGMGSGTGVTAATPGSAATIGGPFGRYLPARRTALPARPAGQGSPAAEDVAYGWTQEPDLGGSWIQREVLMAAHESSGQAENAERRDIGDTTLEQMRTDLIRLSAEYMTGPPLPLFFEMRRVRDRMHAALDRRLWPRDMTDLYFWLGCVNCLMALTASGLGYPRAGEELLRAGWAYAVVIDHRPLMAKLRLEAATLAYWSNRPRQARDLAGSGLQFLAEGPNGAQLQLKYGRAAASIGDADAARTAVAAAHVARDHDYHDDLLEIGGEFAVSLATHHYLAGSALIEIAEQEATSELAQAADLYAAGPAPDELHSRSCKAISRIDLATIQLRRGALDAAIAALEPTFSIPPDQRTRSIPLRLTQIRTELAQPIFRRSSQANDLDTQIEEFCRDTIVADLHDLPGGPA
jgi:hypothetical protein